MIDWLTLRHPMTPELGLVLYERLMSAVGKLVCIAPDGTRAWAKNTLDHEALRSDTPGLFWQVQGNAQGDMMLAIGGSPASIEHGINVFGSGDIRHCAQVIHGFAQRSLQAILPPLQRWECRRIDVTHNYDLKDTRTVKQALRSLLQTDSSRRKATSDRYGGDSVYYSPRSDRQAGKAYHKGPQLRHLIRTGKLDDTILNQQRAALADRLLRLELKIGSRYMRDLQKSARHWLDLTETELNEQHCQFFSHFIGTLEAHDMSNLLTILERTAPTPGQAKAAHRTWALIRVLGYEQTRASIPRATWHRHTALMKRAGLTDADIQGGNVFVIQRQQLDIGQPVNDWSEIERRAA